MLQVKKYMYLPLIINPAFFSGSNVMIENLFWGWRDTQSRACVALAEVLGLVPSTDRAAQTFYNSSRREPDAFSALLSAACTWHTDMHMSNIHIK